LLTLFCNVSWSNLVIVSLFSCNVHISWFITVVQLPEILV